VILIYISAQYYILNLVVFFICVVSFSLFTVGIMIIIILVIL